MPAEKIINGINTEILKDTITEIKASPQIAKFRFRAKNEWINGANVRSTIREFYGAGKEDTSRTRPFTLEADEPKVLLGTDKAPNATEYALHALASCLNDTLVYLAAARGIKVEQVELHLEGELDIQGFLGISDKVRNGFSGIRVNMKVKADTTREQVEELVNLAQKRSPVFDIISNPVPVSVSTEYVPMVKAA